MNSELWTLYQSTVFALEQRFSPDFSFAIVTAFNPLGENLSCGQNALLDNELQEAINDRSILARSIYGCSPDLSHWEKSWAIFTEKDQAIAIAKSFRQNAMYWVELDQLYLVPALMTQEEEVALGPFSQRLLADISFNYFH